MRLAIVAALLAASLGIPYLSNGYTRENCSQYVSREARLAPETAQDIWQGKGLLLVHECDTLAGCEMAELQQGDIVAFHGAHVAIFEDGALHDSDPRHDGPGLMQYDEKDLWFHGSVRVLRISRTSAGEQR